MTESWTATEDVTLTARASGPCGAFAAAHAQSDSPAEGGRRGGPGPGTPLPGRLRTLSAKQLLVSASRRAGGSARLLDAPRPLLTPLPTALGTLTDASPPRRAEIVSWLLPRLPPSALTAQNTALSTPLHWAALNYHLPVLELLCPRLPLSAFDIKNHHGKTAVQEAEEACEAMVVSEEDQDTPRGKERVRRERCVAYVLGCMGLGVKAPTGGDDNKAEEEAADGEVKASAGGAKADDETVRRLTEQAEKIKLEQEEKAKQQQA